MGNAGFISSTVGILWSLIKWVPGSHLKEQLRGGPEPKKLSASDVRLPDGEAPLQSALWFRVLVFIDIVFKVRVYRGYSPGRNRVSFPG